MYTLFYGALVTPESLTKYTAAPQALVCVSRTSGDIEWVEHDVPPSRFEDTLAKHGLVDLQGHEIVELKHGEFIMPGFIDTHLVRPSVSCPVLPYGAHDSVFQHPCQVPNAGRYV